MPTLLRRLFAGQRARHFIVIDIGSNSAIRSLRFSASNDEYIALKKQYFELPARERDADLIPHINEYLRRLIFQYLREVGRVPDVALIGLGSHFTFNEVITTRRLRKHPREAIRARELQNILGDFLEEHREKLIGDSAYTLVHVMPFRISIDGYPVDTISAHTNGTVVEMSLFTTYALSSYWQSLWQLTSLWGGLELKFISNQAAIAAAVISLLTVPDALLIKIGAKITEVSLVGSNAILFTGQFDYGGNDFTQAIAKRLDMPFRDAEAIKRQWGETLLPLKIRDAAAEAIATAVDSWLEKLVKLCGSDDRFLLPERVFLLGGGARLRTISEIMNSRPWYSDLTFLERLDTRILDAQALAPSVFRNSTPLLNGPEEVALVALAARMRQSAPAALQHSL